MNEKKSDVSVSKTTESNVRSDDKREPIMSRPMAIFMIILFIMCFVVHFVFNGIRSNDTASSESSNSVYAVETEKE